MLSQLTDSDYLERLLAKHGVTPQRSSGQNFLVCEEPIEAIVTAMEAATPAVTELGAGVGSLTQALVAAGYQVRAIERERKLAHLLQRVMPKKQQAALDLQIGDLRTIDWQWDMPWQLVGNIPYNLSGYIFRRLTELPAPPTQAIFLVQREVGLRLSAEPPAMNLLGLTAQLWASVHPLLNVPRSCFWPVPEVDSMVVLLVPHAQPMPRVERAAVLNVARVFFQQKRKQIGGMLKRQFGWSADRIATVVATMEVTAAARPQELSVPQWRALWAETNI